MPTSEAPTSPETPTSAPAETAASQSAQPLSVDTHPDAPSQDSVAPAPTTRGAANRYTDYDSHELLEMISELEDERRWARIREGIWVSILIHLAIFALLAFLPRYFHSPAIIDPSANRKDFTYLDSAEALKSLQRAKPLPKAIHPNIDRQTLHQLEAQRKATPPAPAPPQPAPQPAAATQQPVKPAPQPPTQTAQALPPAPQPEPQAAPAPQPQIDSPRPSPVPARPNFNTGALSAAGQLSEALKNAARGRGQSSGNYSGGGNGMAHPGAEGGAEILSDTMGVDFGPYMQKLIRETYRAWDPLIPSEVNPPISKSGQVLYRFKILPNGRVDSITLEGRSGDVALDRAAWGALTSADFPPLPRDFHGPYLELRFLFQYNMRK